MVKNTIARIRAVNLRASKTPDVIRVGVVIFESSDSTTLSNPSGPVTGTADKILEATFILNMGFIFFLLPLRGNRRILRIQKS